MKVPVYFRVRILLLVTFSVGFSAALNCYDCKHNGVSKGEVSQLPCSKLSENPSQTEGTVCSLSFVNMMNKQGVLYVNLARGAMKCSAYMESFAKRVEKIHFTILFGACFECQDELCNKYVIASSSAEKDTILTASPIETTTSANSTAGAGVQVLGGACAVLVLRYV